MRRRHRHGFTLIELLVVIGVLLLLVGIAVLAFLHFDTVASGKLTSVRLENCKSLMIEYDLQSGGLGLIEGAAPPAIYATGAAISAVSLGDVNFGGGSRFSGPVLSTANVFQKFSQRPDMATTIAHLPGEAMLQQSTGTGAIPWVDANKKPLPVMLDGWKNPIIFVPSGGLRFVYLGGVKPPSWTVPGGYSGSPTTPEGGGQWAKRRVRVLSLDSRPFWASAGPDGSFETGDDNIYSGPVSTTTGGTLVPPTGDE